LKKGKKGDKANIAKADRKEIEMSTLVETDDGTVLSLSKE
jgi:hypothetical protein